MERNSLILKKPIGHLSAGAAPAAAPRAFGTGSNQQRAAAPALPDPRVILNSIGEVVYDWDISDDRLTWGANAREVLGLADLTPVSTGQGFAECQTDESTTSRFNAIFQSDEKDRGSGVRYQVRYGLQLGDNGRGGSTVMHVEDSGRWFAGIDGRPVRAHGVVRRISAPAVAPVAVASAAQSNDALTGALNRNVFAEHLGKMFIEANRNQTSFALLLASIDTLPIVNRSFGYDIGDELIAGVAKRIAGQMRTTDVIGRYTGNKLALALDACDPEQMLVAANR